LPPAGVAYVAGGNEVTVEGSGFATPRPDAGPVRILIDNEVVLDNVQVDANGAFRVRIRVDRVVGDYEIKVEQRDGKRLTREKTALKVVPRDEEGRKSHPPGPFPPPKAN
jgi:hypothetical protein